MMITIRATNSGEQGAQKVNNITIGRGRRVTAGAWGVARTLGIPTALDP